MVAEILDGKLVAKECRIELKKKVAAYAERKGYPPGLGVILVGDDPASQVYVRNKEKMCARVGIESFHHDLPNDASAEALRACIDQLNENPRVHGILLQLPIPDHLDTNEMVSRIHPEKDSDGIHSVSAGMLAVGTPTYVSCTPKGCMKLIEKSGVPVSGKRAVVVGRSNLVGKPIAQLLLAQNATVTICHSRTADLPGEVANADILVAAIGRPELVKGDWIKPGAVVIDVGINRLDSGQLVGDVEYEAAAERASWITPVPGGVGPMTIAMLLENTYEGAMRYDG